QLMNECGPDNSEDEEDGNFDEPGYLEARQNYHAARNQLFDMIPHSIREFLHNRINELVPILHSHGRQKTVEKKDVEQMIREFYDFTLYTPNLVFVTELTRDELKDI